MCFIKRVHLLKRFSKKYLLEREAQVCYYELFKHFYICLLQFINYCLYYKYTSCTISTLNMTSWLLILLMICFVTLLMFVDNLRMVSCLVSMQAVKSSDPVKCTYKRYIGINYELLKSVILLIIVKYPLFACVIVNEDPWICEMRVPTHMVRND